MEKATRVEILEIILKVECPKCKTFNMYCVYKGKVDTYGCQRCQIIFKMSDKIKEIVNEKEIVDE